MKKNAKLKLYGVLMISLFLGSSDIKFSVNATSSPIITRSEVVVDQIEASNNFSFLVESDGSLWAWGENQPYGQLGDGTLVNKFSPVKIMQDVVSVFSGENHSFAIKRDQSLWGWGYNGSGQLGIGSTVNKTSPVKIMDNIVSVSVGWYNTFAIKTDGSLWAWGGNQAYDLGDGSSSNQLSPVKIMDNVVSVSTGYHHTLVVKSDGSLWAWGLNYFGEVGDGTTTGKLPVKIMDNVVKISAGYNFSLALKSDNSLWTWGNNIYGQLGDGTATDKLIPVKILDGIIDISAGESHSFAIRSNGTLLSWGNNEFGKLGDGSIISSLVPKQIIENVTSISAGTNHTLAIRNDNSIWAWGSNSKGELGDGKEKSSNIPVEIKFQIPTLFSISSDDLLIKSFVAGDWNSFIIKGDSSLWASGNNNYGQLGDGTTANKAMHVKVLDDVLKVSSGYNHTLAIKSDFTLWAWGNNVDGLLGNGSTTSKSIPVKIMDNVVSVSAGKYHSLAIKSDGSLWAWGNNSYGQLGDGTTSSKVLPVKVMEDVIYISAGIWNSFVIKKDGSLWAWGFNSIGQLGDGTVVNKLNPVKIMDNVAIVNGEDTHTLAIKIDGSLWTWGNNSYGQLGDGTTASKVLPVKVMEDVVSVSVGSQFSFAIKKDNSLWSWGLNNYGQLGDGNNGTDRTTPIKVMNNVVKITTGYAHSLAVLGDGSLWAWGESSNGQLGDGIITGLPKASPDPKMILSSEKYYKVDLTDVLYLPLYSFAPKVYLSYNVDRTAKYRLKSQDLSDNISVTTSNQVIALKDGTGIIEVTNEAGTIVYKTIYVVAYSEKPIIATDSPTIKSTNKPVLVGNSYVTYVNEELFTGSTINVEGIYSVTTYDIGGFEFTTSFVIDLLSPDISIENYNEMPTNQNILVTASTNEGIMNSITHIFYENGSFDFIATDEAGNVTTQTVIITNIDKTQPIISGVTNDSANSSNLSLSFNEGIGKLNGLDYASGTLISTEGTYTLVVVDLAGNSSSVNFVIDKTAPIANGVENNQYYNTNRIITFNEGTAKLNGSLFISGTTVSTAGSYTLVVTDTAGNVTTIGFTIDKTAPVINGVIDGGYYNINKTITFNEGTALLNGVSFISGTTIITEGNYNLVVTDLAGNNTSISFVIDKTKPIIDGVQDGSVSYDGFTIRFNEGSATLNGQTIITNTLVNAEGPYVLIVTDPSGNSSEVRFVIDKTAPIINGVNHNGIYNVSKTITFNEGIATLNGNTIVSGSVISGEGSYELIVTDLAGNRTTINFTIDKTKPTVEGPIDNGYYNASINIAFSDGTAALNSVVIQNNTLVIAEGSYTLVITDLAGNSTTVRFTLDFTAPTLIIGESLDQPLNTSFVRIRINGQEFFYLKESVSISGATTISGNLVVPSNVTLSINGSLVVTGNLYLYGNLNNYNTLNVYGSINCHNYNNMMFSGSGSSYGRFFNYGTATVGTLSVVNRQYITNPMSLISYNGATLTGKILPGMRVIINGIPVTVLSDGAFSINYSNSENTTIIVEDIFGFENTYSFSVDQVNNINKSTIGIRKMLISFSDGIATLNGNIISNNYLVETEGYYVVEVTDSAGNKTIQDFELDWTAPLIFGVTDNSFYNTSLAVTFNEGVATLNNNPYEAGTVISSEGSYTLVVTDEFNNSTSITFTIDKTSPIISGVSSFGYYNLDKKVTFNEGTALLDSVAFTSGSYISTEGTHILVVTDLAGNSSSVTFTIDKTVPLITGVSNSANYNVSKTITFNEGYATLDGIPFSSGSLVTSEGNHILVVTDFAGNVSAITFTLDFTAPEVIGVEDEGWYNTYIIITFNEGTATLNGTAFVSGSSVATEGAYQLIITDLVGYITTIDFTIDKTNPEITGVSDNEFYNSPRTLEFNEGVGLLNGQTISSGMEVSDEGTYTLVVTDLAGNITTVTFVIDVTTPIISGLDRDRYAIRTPEITFNEGTATLNGSVFISGSIISASGNYKLIVTDLAGNQSIKEFSVSVSIASPINLSIMKRTFNSIEITWDSVNDSLGYEIYRSTSSTGVYTLIGTSLINSYTNSGISFNTTYYYKIKAYYSDGTDTIYSGYSSSINALTGLPQVDELSSVSTGYSSNSLNWMTVDGASGYEIFRSIGTSTTYTLLSTTTATTYTNTSLLTNTKYNYKVRAYRLVGALKVYGAFSSFVSATPLPSAPMTNIVSASYNSLKVTWPVVAGANGYEVSYSTSENGIYTKLALLTTNSASIANLLTNSTYFVKVRAYRTVNYVKIYGAYSNIASGAPIPSTPIVTAASLGYDSIKVSWGAITGATRYELYKLNTETSSYELLQDTSLLTYTDTGLVTGTDTSYKVKAYRLVGETKVYSLDSSIITSKALPSVVTGIKTQFPKYTELSLSWTAVTGATGYEISRSTTLTGTYALLTIVEGDTTYTNTGLAFNTTYYYKVRAYTTVNDVKVYGTYPVAASGKTALEAVLNPTAAYTSYNSNLVKWSAVTGATGYEIYRSIGTSTTYALLTTPTALSYTNTALLTNYRYNYKIRAYRLVGTVKVYGAFSSIVSSTPLPWAPTATVTSSGYNSLKVTWLVVAGANGYEVSYSTSETGTYTKLALVTTNTASIINLLTNTTYYVKVRAYRTVNYVKIYGASSTIVSGSPIPSTPTLNVVSVDFETLRISWPAVLGASGYELSVLNAVVPSFSVILDTTSLSYTHTGLPTGPSQTYRIRAYRLVGEIKIYSLYSTEVTVSPMPEAVLNFKVTKQSVDQIEFSWSPVKGATGYQISQYSSTNGYYTSVGIVEDSTTFTVTGLTFNTSYTFRISAYTTFDRNDVYGPLSTLTTKTIPSPVVISVSSPSYTSIQVDWSAVSGATGYEIYRSTGTSTTYTLLKTQTTVGYLNTGLIFNTKYNYKVRAYKLSGTTKIYGAYSSIVSGIPVYSSPSSLIVVSSGYNSLYVSWAVVAGVSGYEVSYSTSEGGAYSILPLVTTPNISISSLATNTSYFIRVRTYRLVGTTKVYGGYSSIVSSKPIPNAPVLSVASGLTPKSGSRLK